MEHFTNIVLMYTQFVIINFILVILGRRIVACLPLVIREDYGFYLAPILGLATLMIVAVVYGWIFPFNFLSSLILIISLLLLALFYENSIKETVYAIGRVCLFAVVCAFPIMFFIIKYDGFNPATDIFTYLAQAQWLQEHPFREKVVTSGYFPYLTQIAAYQGPGSRMGGTFLLGFLQSLFNIRWSYNAYIVTVSTAISCGCLVYGAYIKQAFSLQRLPVFLLSLLPAYSLNGYIFGAQWGFFPQTFGLSFALTMACILPIMIKYNLENTVLLRKKILHFFPLALIMSAFLFAYNEPFLIFGFGLFLYFIFLLIYEPKKRLLLCQLFVIFASEVVILTNYEFIRIIRNLLQTMNIARGLGEIGWPVLWKPWQFAAYSFGLYDYLFTSKVVLSIDFCLFLLVFVMIGIKIFSLWRNNKDLRYLLALLFAVELAFIICFVDFRYFYHSLSPGEVGFSFMQFKIAKYAAPFSMAILILAVAAYYKQFIKYKLYLCTCCIVAIFISAIFIVPANVKRLYLSFSNQVGVQKHVLQPFLQLREYVSSHRSLLPTYIHLGAGGDKLRQMIAYTLYDMPIMSNYSDDGYIKGRLPIEDVVMRSQHANSMIFLTKQFVGKSNINVKFGACSLISKPFQGIMLENSVSAYPIELIGKNSWYWVNDEITNSYKIVGKTDAVKISFELYPHPSARNFNIYIRNNNNREILHKSLKNFAGGVIHLPQISLTNTKRLVLKITADGVAQAITKRDQRQAKFMLRNIKLQ